LRALRSRVEAGDDGYWVHRLDAAIAACDVAPRQS
jgi:hypothetical protein